MTDVPEPTPATWRRVLDALDRELCAAEHLLAVIEREGTPGGIAGDGGALPGDHGWLPPGAPDERPAPTEQVHLNHLRARHVVLIGRLTAAMAVNRRHRALLRRAAADPRRSIFVDRTA